LTERGAAVGRERGVKQKTLTENVVRRKTHGRCDGEDTLHGRRIGR